MVFDLGEESNKIGKMAKLMKVILKYQKHVMQNVCEYSTCKIRPLSVD